jgi:glycosyltransferase involved in cell wall biosynthesis
LFLVAGRGLVFIEAFRNGTPVITSDRGTLPEPVGLGITGFTFDLNNIEHELGVSILTYQRVNDKTLIRRVCLDEYLTNYSLSRYYKKYGQ